MFGKAKIIVVFLSALFVAYGLVGGMLNEVSARDDTYQDLSVFMDVLTKVREDYVEEPDMGESDTGSIAWDDGGSGSLLQFYRQPDLQ